MNDKLGVKGVVEKLEVAAIHKAMVVRVGEVIHNEPGVKVKVEAEMSTEMVVEEVVNCRQLGAAVVMVMVAANSEQAVVVAGEVLHMEVAGVVLYTEVVGVVNLAEVVVNT